MTNTTLRAMVNRAERLVRTEVYEEALALCHAILRRYPRYARCYRILGEVYLALGEHGEAASLFRRALGVDPEDPVGYAGLGLIFEERSLLDEAIWQLERAFELAPGKDELRRELARLYRKRGSATRVQLTRAALARLYARGGLWNKAIGELRDLLVREPYRLDLRVTLSRTLWRAGQREEAAAVAQSILDLAPNCLLARLILGTYWCHEGRDDEGRALLRGAEELDPEGREAARLLGEVSTLPRRRAEVELAPKDSLPVGPDEGEASAWPRVVTRQPGVEDAGAPAVLGGEEGSAEEHIMALPKESLQALLGSLAVPAALDAPEDHLGVVGEWAALQVQAGESEGADDRPAHPNLGPVQGLPVEDSPTVLLSPLSVLQRRLDAAPEDHEARLGLARALVAAGGLAEALSHYETLASSVPTVLDTVLADLEAMARQDGANRALRVLLGDAYARAGRFQQAMEMYRWLSLHGSNDAAGG